MLFRFIISFILIICSNVRVLNDLSFAQEKEPPKILSIAVKGNFVLSDQKIFDEANLITALGEEMMKEKLESDVKSIYGLGVFKKVNYYLAYKKDGLKVFFEVLENPPVKKIEIKGNTVFTVQELKAKMASREDEILNTNNLQKDIILLEDLYQQAGYSFAKVVDIESTPEAIIKLKIVEGIIETVQIEGNEVTRDYVIRRELKTKPGNVLNRKLLEDDLHRVFNLGYFSEVLPSLEEGVDKEKVVLTLNVTEQRTAYVNAGGGYGQREGWFLFSDLSVDNIMGTGQGILLKGQFGGLQTTYQFKYNTRWIFNRPIAFTARSWNTIGRDIYVTYQNEGRVGLDLTFSRYFNDNLSSSMAIKAEDVYPETDPFYQTRGLSFGLTYDTRDIWMNPTRGMLTSVTFTPYGGFFGGTINSLRYDAEFNKFFYLGPSQTFAFRIIGNLANGDVRKQDEYWAGGPFTVRGYTAPFRTGTWRMILNFEYRYTFDPTFQGVIFYDTGTTGYVPDLSNFERFQGGRGFGLRINTPVGPIRIDYGIPDWAGIGEGIYHFTIGHIF